MQIYLTRRRTLVSSLIVALCFAGTLPAQSTIEFASIKGKVVEADSKQPIAYVDVFIKSLGRGDVTDQNGLYEIKNVPPGSYDLTFSRQGYKTLNFREVSLSPGAELRFDAEMPETALRTDEIVVTATRTTEYEHDIPQPVSVVTLQEIRDKNIVQTPELLREEEGIFVQKTNQGGGSPLLRGLKANKILLLVDGVRMNNSTYRSGNTQYLNTIDANALQRVEVVRGPASALYGSDALGGAINNITPTPSLAEAGQFRWRGRLTGLATTADETRAGGFEFQGANDKLGVLLNLSFKSYGDITRGSNGGDLLMQRLAGDSRRPRLLNKTQVPNGYDAYDATLKALFQPSGKHHITALYQVSRQPEVPRYDVFEVQRFSRWFYDPQERDFAYLGYKHTQSNMLYDFATLTFSFHRQAETRISQRSGSQIEAQDGFSVRTLGLQSQLNKVVGRDNFIVYGIELYADDVTSSSFERDLSAGIETPVQPLYPDNATYFNFGTYLQSDVNVLERWKVDAGVRYSEFRLNAPLPPEATGSLGFDKVEQSPSAITLSLGSTYKLTEAINFVANIAQGFRAPNLDDVGKLGIGKGGSFYDVPNPSASPEKLLSYEGGFKFFSERFKGNMIAFYSDITGLLLRRPALYDGLPYIVEEGDTLAVFRTENAGEAYVAGAEMSGRLKLLPVLTLQANLTYTYGRNKSDDEPLSAIPPANGFLGLRYEQEGYWLEVYSRFATEQDRLSAEDKEDLRIPEGGTPGWWTLNLRGGVRPFSWLSLRAGIGNLLDRNYREHVSGFNAPGRNLMLSGELRF